MVTNLTPVEWKRGDYRQLAELAASPDDLTRRLGIRFFDSEEDGLGACDRAIVRLSTGRELMLVHLRHELPPGPFGTYIEAELVPSPAAALAEIGDALNLQGEPALWVHPDAPPGRWLSVRPRAPKPDFRRGPG